MQRVIMRNDSAMMPTMPKLVGAIGLALTGVMTVALLEPYLNAEVKTDGLQLVAISFGMLLGWRVIGTDGGGRPGKTAAAGFRAAFYLGICTLLFLGAVQMLLKALRMRYDGPIEALGDVVSQGVAVGYMVLQVDVIAMLFLGGAVTAILSSWAGRRWR